MEYVNLNVPNITPSLICTFNLTLNALFREAAVDENIELHCNSRTYLPQEQWRSLSFVLIEATIVVTCRPPGFMAGWPQCDRESS